MLVYFPLGNLDACNGSIRCSSHVLDLKEVSLKIMMIFYSSLVVADDLYHFKGQTLIGIEVFLNYLIL